MNFNRVEKVNILGKGGEAVVFSVTPYLPMEVIAKVPLAKEGDCQVFADLLQENHLLKLLANKDYVCEVLEEVALYNSKHDKIIGMVALIESASNDLSKVIKTWKNEDLSFKRLEFFSENKLAYFCLKAMEAISFLHVNNVYFGDMKPENLLLFKDYRVKLGDFGVSMKIADNATPDTEVFMKGLTHKYTMPELEIKYMKDQAITVKELFTND